MIYGLIPVGGKGTRLGLPFSKEMLPQKGFDYYNPIINHVVEKMQLAGASKIVFVHGYKFKKDVLVHFNKDEHIHVMQQKLGFANVIHDLYTSQDLKDDDKILFGLPDSVFDQNPFVKMLQSSGIVCGLFKTTKNSKVDRLQDNKFLVKSVKTQETSDWFWGILKFDGVDIRNLITSNAFDTYSEIGDILNTSDDLKFVHGERYLDLGTWNNYNRYLTDNTNFSNVEIEKKYDADNVLTIDFINMFKELNYDYFEIESKDYYYQIDNPNVEFVRYREDSADEGSIPDITVKNYNQSQMNRFELSVALSKPVSTHNVNHLLSLMGASFLFDVKKHCYIFKSKDYTVVMYSFMLGDQLKQVIEVELEVVDFNLISQIEDTLCDLKGFDVTNVINKSKFQMIKEYYDTTQ